MIQRRERTRFALEAGQPLRVVGKRVREYLNRHGAAGPLRARSACARGAESSEHRDDSRARISGALPSEQLFSGPFDLSYTSYAISKDGTHFIMVEVDPNARPTQLNVVLNRAEEVKRTK